MKKIKMGFFKRGILVLVSLFICYTGIKPVLKIAYLGVTGEEASGKLIAIDEKTHSSRGHVYRDYIPIVRININGEEKDIYANLNKMDFNLVDFVGENIEVKYSKEDYKLLFINNWKYLINNIANSLIFFQLGLIVFIAIIFAGKNLDKPEYDLKLWKKILMISMGIPGVMGMVLYFYNEIALANYAFEDINIIENLGILLFFGLYILVILRLGIFNKNKNK